MTEMFKRSLPLEDAYNALQRSHIFPTMHQQVTRKPHPWKSPGKKTIYVSSTHRQAPTMQSKQDA